MGAYKMGEIVQRKTFWIEIHEEEDCHGTFVVTTEGIMCIKCKKRFKKTEILEARRQGRIGEALASRQRDIVNKMREGFNGI